MPIAPNGIQHARCPLLRCAGLLEHEMRPGGAVVTRCPRCDRRRAGLCRDCPRPVYGTVGKAMRCADCAREARRVSEARWMSDPNNRRKRNASHRRRWRQKPELRKRKREQRRAWASAHPDRIKRSRRRYHLKQTPGYVAGYQRANANPVRAEQKRQQARAKYYELHPTRPSPVCAACGEPIAWQPPGRPPKYHAEHSPWKRQLKSHRTAEARVA